MSDNFLHKYFLGNSNKVLHKWVHYFDIYERHLARFRGKSPVMVEIGVSAGGSLAMWKEYFGDGCKIIGVDINPECKKHESTGVEIIIGSQNDPIVKDQIFGKYSKIDIFLDDGSHHSQNMRESYNLYYDRISSNGVYIVEDTHACYWPEYGGGFRDPASFLEFTKEKIDDLNAFHTRDAMPVSDFTRSTDSINIYDSIVVFEKRPQGSRHAPMTGPMG